MSLPVGNKFFQSDDSGPVSWLLDLGSSSDHIIILAVRRLSWKQKDS